eukprot:scaffold1388_cov267-Chaetoceros_neogracile.AAC.52
MVPVQVGFRCEYWVCITTLIGVVGGGGLVVGLWVVGCGLSLTANRPAVGMDLQKGNNKF